MLSTEDLKLGMRMRTEDWLDLNGRLAFTGDHYLEHVAPFPPQELMHNVSGLDSEQDFAAHGVAIYRAIQQASPKPLADYPTIFDFGCGCGRLARMFKGHPGQVTGCDLDGRHVDWINGHLPFMRAVQTRPNAALPFTDASFAAVISISVFTHLDEASQDFYLAELARVSESGAYLFLTTHGERAMERALTEERIFAMLDIPSANLQKASAAMTEGKHHFVLQSGHLTTDEFKYGITFIPSSYVRRRWSEYFEIVDIVSGGIHDFQDIVVCRKR